MDSRHKNLGISLAIWTVFLIGLVVVGCQFSVPRQEWSKKQWGPLVPHTKFPGDCSICHLPERWDKLRDDFTFDHAKEAGFPLKGRHAEAACLRCHNDMGPVETYVARGCSGCHQDPHAASLGLDCQQCHNEMTWQPSGLVGEHARTRFPLVGAHAATACESCHTGAPAGDFRGAPIKCETCHQEQLAQATEPDHIANGWVMECQRCHNPVNWAGENFDHSFFPLTGVHGELSCTDCHTDGGFSGLSSDCYSCHGSDYESAPDHVTLEFSHVCSDCHAPTGWKPASFDHSSFPLTGGHASLDCTQCHATDTFAGLSTDCYSCHDSDFQGAPNHVAQSYPQSCDQCHTISAWVPASFNHSAFPLAGGHAGLTCLQCHTGGTYAQIASDCYSCHDTDYQNAPDHVSLNFSQNCVDCHSSTAWTPAAFDHSAFPLTGSHAALDCSQCHAADTFTGLSSDCYACHDTDYQGAPDHVALAYPQTCDQCHGTLNWIPATFDHSGFPLTAGHSGLSCAQCHTDGTYAALPTDCYSCHDTDFQGAPDHVAQSYSHNCEQCHVKTAWTPATFDHSFFPLTEGHGGLTCVQCHTDGTFGSLPSDCYTCHDADFQGAPSHVELAFARDCEQCHTRSAWTPSTYDHSVFPLTGSHAAVSCVQCHGEGTFTGLSTDCAACHSVDYQGAPNHVDQAYPQTCEQCHGTSAWTPATFDHSAFPLTGGHGGLVCAQCHVGGNFTSLPTDCYSCHAANYQTAPDHVALSFPHTCEGCHSTTAWTPAAFDHSFFPLTEGHSGLTCAQCHADGTYTGLTPDCYSCHDADFQSAPSHVELAFEHDCEQCHTRTAWTPATFNHSFFPLTEGHSGLDCAQCHNDGTFTSKTPDCYSCHDTDYQSAPDHLAQGYAHTCDDCHSRTAWTPANFDHSFFPLTQGHAGLACSQCHSGGTYTGLTPDCYSCHTPDYQSAPDHVAQNYSHTCDDCHTRSAWVPSTFDHSSFPLTGGHNGLDCVQCHVAGTYTGLSTDCFACHDTDFQGAPSHVDLGFSHTCLDCHSPTSWTPANFDHSIFPLTGAHSALACDQCHTDGTFSGLIPDCYSCHAPDFQGAPDHVALGFSHNCDDCHTRVAWQPSTFDHSQFPLTQGHSGLSCAQCHSGGTYTGLSQDCYSCHDSDFQGAPSHVELNFSHACDDCHTRAAWTPATFDHSIFPLTEGHSGLLCTQCHVGGTYTGLVPDCYSCHDTDYQGAPDHANLNFSHTCDDCHTRSAWTPSTFDHSALFPLTEGHSGLLCAQCHVGGTTAGLTPDCYSCHATDYQGAPDHVAQNYSHTCEDCHTRSTWAGAAIDHSFFPLTGGHSSLTCSQCHSGGTYTGLSQDCYSCHDTDYKNAPNHANIGIPHTCEDCHSIAAWTPSTFRHDFPLTGNHSVSCATCHDSGTTSVFNCLSCHAHNKTSMDSEHRNRNGYVYESSACYNCHPNGRG